jgi:hypothetical protein
MMWQHLAWLKRQRQTQTLPHGQFNGQQTIFSTDAYYEMKFKKTDYMNLKCLPKYCVMQLNSKPGNQLLLGKSRQPNTLSFQTSQK